MRRIDKLLFHAITPPFFITLAVLTFVVSVHEFGTLSELLITRNASIGVMLTIIGSILPAILIFSLPLSFLISLLIGLSGLSGESQILALRACGVPLRSMLRFILLFGGIVGFLTGIISLVILPQTNDMRRSLVDRISVSLATTKIQPRVFNEDFASLVFYLDDLSADRKHWAGVFLADNSDPKAPQIIIARSARWITDPLNKRIQLHLEKGAAYSTNSEDTRKDSVSEFKSTDIPFDIKRSSAGSGYAEGHPRKVTEQSSLYLWQNYRTSPLEEKRKQIVELNRRIALPFAIFPFAILGLALAVSTPKSGRTSGFALSLVTVIIFYMLFFNGWRLALVGKVPAWLGVWGANIILALIGWFLLAKVEKRFALSHWGARFPWNLQRIAITWRFRTDRLRKRVANIDNAVIQSLGRFIRLLFPKILDIHVLRGFWTYFFWSLMTCGTLFVLLTIFELMDDVIRNKIPIISLLDYLVFLIPQILMFAIPVSVLLAVLINLGILEKNSEITALKAGGWSLYRVAVPVFLISSVLSLGLFLMQDYILPYANDRQDSLRNYIQNKPPQTSKRLQRKWIFGEGGRIYNYEYFDSNRDEFVDLNVYDIDFKNVRILRHIHVEQALIASDGTWRLKNGWVRDYQSAHSGFSLLKAKNVRFPEKAAYFKKEIFQPKESSKLTYQELNQYIKYLEKSGYNAMELQVELYKKISFPVSCLIMALLGVPFSFSVGKKGAFFGIGMSIAIAISYWGFSGAFEAMGAFGILLPILAAWAPNLLFGAAGLALFLTIRT
jgi:LPS export ABC transporter permease LptG/LPS export ABC transporter permease LptF